MNTEERTAIEGRTLLLFDGLCGLCNGTVRFLIRRDSAQQLLYAPLESPLGREMLAQAGKSSDGVNGIVLVEKALTPEQAATVRSDAAIRTLLHLRGPWPTVGRLLGMVPRWLRELAYRFVATRRYGVFGAYKLCPLPTVEESGLILGFGTEHAE